MHGGNDGYGNNGNVKNMSRKISDVIFDLRKKLRSNSGNNMSGGGCGCSKPPSDANVNNKIHFGGFHRKSYERFSRN